MADQKEQAATIQLNGVDFGALTKQIIAEKVTEGLFNHEKIVQGIVVEALSMKVDTNGNPTRYHDDRAVNWLEWLTKDVIRKAVTTVVQARVEQMQPQLEKAVEKALRESSSEAAKVLVADFVERSRSMYSPGIDVQIGLRASKRG